jgi:hypothetical protein
MASPGGGFTPHWGAGSSQLYAFPASSMSQLLENTLRLIRKSQARVLPKFR